MCASYENVQSGGEDVQLVALERKNFTVNHDVHGNGNVELDVADGFARRERMLDVRAVVETRKHAQQAKAADRAPAYKLDEAVGGIGFGRDEHGATSVLAVVEGKEKAAAVVPDGFVVRAQCEGTALQLNHTNEYTEQIAQAPKRLEKAIGDRGDIGGEAEA